MPNWMYNSVTIEGSPEDIARVKEQLARPYESTHFDFMKNEIITITRNESFAFWNIIKPANEQEYHDKPNEKQDINNPNHWYMWNTRHWGTKWEASEVYFVEESETPNTLCYTFSTAWSTPHSALLKLSEQYPNLVIENEYEEEGGWGGTSTYEDGDVSHSNDYDFKCRNCGALDEDKYCYTCEDSVCQACNNTSSEYTECEHIKEDKNVSLTTN